CRDRCLLLLRRRTGGIESEYFVGVVLELGADAIGIWRRTFRQTDPRREEASFVGIPADEQRHAVMFSTRVYQRPVLRHDITVNNAKTIRDRVLNGGLQHLLGRLSAQLGNRACTHRLNEFGAILLADLKRLGPKRGNRREGAAAFPDRARK